MTNKNSLNESAEESEQLQFRLHFNFIREAEEAIVRELAAIQRVKDHLNAPLRLCLLRSEFIISEIGEWPLDNLVHFFNALMRFLTSMTEMISQAKLALFSGTPEERERLLNDVQQLAESSTECRKKLQRIIRLASDSLTRFRETLSNGLLMAGRV